MKLGMTVVLVVASASLAGCNGAAPDNGANVQALKDSETQWNADFAAKDAARIVAHYADDATLMISGDEPTVGKQAITAEFTAMVGDPAFSLQIHTEKVVVAKSGDVGFTQGSYTLTSTNPVDKSVAHEEGAYLTGYRKEADGSWKAVSDAAISGLPAAVAQAK